MDIEKENKEKKFLEVPLHSPIEGYTDEMNSYYQSYLPRGNRLVRALDLFSFPQATRFSTGGFANTFKDRIATHVLRSAESMTGNVLYAQESILPRDWKKILQVLKEKNFLQDGDIFPIRPRNDDPKCLMVGTRYHTSKEDFLFGKIREYFAFGLSQTDFLEAISKAIGESLERFALLPHARYPMIIASITDLKKRGKRFLSPEECAAFSDEQKEWFPEMRFDAARPLRWVEGRQYPSGERVLLPAQFVFWQYPAHKQGEVVYRESNTNGAAGMFTLEEAILAGLYELIQRDGFVIHWLWSAKPPRVDLDTIQDKESRALLDMLKRYRIRCEVLDVSTNVGVPIFLSVFIDDALSGKRCVTVSAGCNLTWQKALYGAVLENMGMLYGSRFIKPFSLSENYQPFRDKSVGHFDRVGLWFDAAMLRYMEPFLEGPRVSADDLAVKYSKFSQEKELPLVFLAQELGRLGNGYEIYYYEAPHLLLKDVGYHVVKVIVPALVPIYLNEPLAPLGSPRLLGAKRFLKSKTGVFPNPIPHPFP